MTLRASPHPANVLDCSNWQAGSISLLLQTKTCRERMLTLKRRVPRPPNYETLRGNNDVTSAHPKAVDFVGGFIVITYDPPPPPCPRAQSPSPSRNRRDFPSYLPTRRPPAG